MQRGLYRESDIGTFKLSNITNIYKNCDKPFSWVGYVPGIATVAGTPTFAGIPAVIGAHPTVGFQDVPTG